jgi:hypothetical protein
MNSLSYSDRISISPFMAKLKSTLSLPPPSFIHFSNNVSLSTYLPCAHPQKQKHKNLHLFKKNHFSYLKLYFESFIYFIPKSLSLFSLSLISLSLISFSLISHSLISLSLIFLSLISLSLISLFLFSLSLISLSLFSLYLISFSLFSLSLISLIPIFIIIHYSINPHATIY